MADTREVLCRCGLAYPAWSIKKTRSFICSECGMDLRPLAEALRAAIDDAKEPQ